MRRHSRVPGFMRRSYKMRATAPTITANDPYRFLARRSTACGRRHFVEVFLRFAAAMRAVDKSIKLIACGAHFPLGGSGYVDRTAASVRATMDSKISGFANQLELRSTR